jgi:biopolymer transport protein ExbB/TolQ
MRLCQRGGQRGFLNVTRVVAFGPQEKDRIVMTEQLPGALNLLILWGPPVLALLLASMVAALVLVIVELKRLRASVFTFDNSIHLRLRDLQNQVQAASPARYALASFIAAQKDSGRATRDLRVEFEAMLGDFERLEDAVDDVLRALEQADHAPVNGARRPHA